MGNESSDGDRTSRHDKQTEPASKWGNFSDRVMAALTLVLAAVAFAQWRTSNRQAETTRLQLQTQQVELRAYVSTNIKRISQFDSKTAPTFDFEIINHGQTPARDVEFRAMVGILPNSAREIPDIDTGWIARRMNLFPNANQTSGDRGEIPWNCGRVFSRQEIDQMRATTHFIFIGLEIQYWDFVGGAGHITRNYYRLGATNLAALRCLTMEGTEEVEVTGLNEKQLLPTFSIIPGCSLIT